MNDAGSSDEANEAHRDIDSALGPRPTKNTWLRWIVTGGGLGLLRPAPGSWGTLGPAAIYVAARYLGLTDPFLSLLLLALALVASILLVSLGRWACGYFQKMDPGQVVLDEYAGFWLTVAFLPVPAWAQWQANAGLLQLHPWIFVAGLYILFRLTDTLKLPPARQLEPLPYGWGILLDDLAAGIQANLLARGILWLLATYAPHLFNTGT